MFHCVSFEKSAPRAEERQEVIDDGAEGCGKADDKEKHPATATRRHERIADFAQIARKAASSDSTVSRRPCRFPSSRSMGDMSPAPNQHQAVAALAPGASCNTASATTTATAIGTAATRATCA